MKNADTLNIGGQKNAYGPKIQRQLNAKNTTAVIPDIFIEECAADQSHLIPGIVDKINTINFIQRRKYE